MNEEMPPTQAVSLFSNCGAGDLGFAHAGFAFEVLAEIDDRRLAVAALNLQCAHTVSGDLRDTWPKVVAAYRERRGQEPPGLLAACPPCQGLSSANGDRGKQEDADSGSQDPRNLLVLPIANVVQELRPRSVVVENVRAFLTRKVRHPETQEAISGAVLLISLLADDYRVFPVLVDLAEYGVPQTRVRSFLTFLRADEPCLQHLDASRLLPYPTPTHAPDLGGELPVTVSEALAFRALAALDAGSSERARSEDPLHFVPVWSPMHYRMVAAIPPGTGASAWENDDCPGCGLQDIESDAASCPVCQATLLRPHVVEDAGPRLVKGFRRSSYRRLSPDKPAATITTASNRIGSDRTIHPTENRVLSPRECQELQTFPDDFIWGETLKKNGPGLVRKMIGEAVPPLFTEAHGRVLHKLLHGGKPENLLPADDVRPRKAISKLETAGAEL